MRALALVAAFCAGLTPAWAEPLTFSGTSRSAISLPPQSIQFYTDSTLGTPILTITADGRVQWLGDQSEAAKAFWRLVQRMAPVCTPQGGPP